MKYDQNCNALHLERNCSLHQNKLWRDWQNGTTAKKDVGWQQMSSWVQVNKAFLVQISAWLPSHGQLLSLPACQSTEQRLRALPAMWRIWGGLSSREGKYVEGWRAWGLFHVGRSMLRDESAAAYLKSSNSQTLDWGRHFNKNSLSFVS